MQDLGQNRIEETLQALEELGISGELVRHPAVFTIEEMERLGIALRGEVVKNLFLRDDKGRRHFLVLLPHDKAADLAALRTLLSSSKLSFASPERLMKHLGLTPGSVTVLGLLHEGAAPVEVLVDEELMTRPLLGVHPCDNTATLWITPQQLSLFLSSRGNAVTFAAI
ncbi:MAG TPA: prolyl-tRNA synthetase associated domain-containing protein [Candidatus Galloscillospira excrementipullorum]|nr:prolyl-tRNA synthetase associated domain-containing protein [Candidatus Galloscillospira excrementipullorum]